MPRSIVPTLLLAIAPAALAQSGDAREEALEACLEIERDRERLACFEGVAEDDGRPPRQPEAASAEHAPPVPATVPREAVTNGPPAEPGGEAASRPAPENRASAERADVHSVTVVEVRRNALGHTRFHTADGRVYLQTSANRGRYPDAPFDAELEEASRDSFFLRSPLGGPRVRVSSGD